MSNIILVITIVIIIFYNGFVIIIVIIIIVVGTRTQLEVTDLNNNNKIIHLSLAANPSHLGCCYCCLLF